MDVPIRSFWSFVKNVNRIRAEEDLRAIDVALAAQSPDFGKELRNRLLGELGEPVKQPPEEIDHKAGIAKLRSLM